nr:MAG TPA: hypothetical protein [Microviridae sp.]
MALSPQFLIKIFGDTKKNYTFAPVRSYNHYLMF